MEGLRIIQCPLKSSILHLLIREPIAKVPIIKSKVKAFSEYSFLKCFISQLFLNIKYITRHTINNVRGKSGVLISFLYFCFNQCSYGINLVLYSFVVANPEKKNTIKKNKIIQIQASFVSYRYV